MNMNKFFSIIFSGAVLFLIITMMGISHAFANTAPVRLFYYKDSGPALTSLLAHPSSIDILAPQAYHFDINGILVGSVSPLVLAFTQKNNIKVMPVVTNGNFDAPSFTSILNDPTRQAAAIAMLVNEAKLYHYWGWQIDFEQMDVSYKDAYSTFIANTEAAFKQNNLELSVAVVGKTSDTPSDYPKNLWTNLIGVYDYTALASSSDFISIMSYDDPLSKGPVAPYPWFQSVLAYSLAHIPAQKISLGIPLYYWEWNSTTGKLVEVGGAAGIQHALLRPGATIGYDPLQHAEFLNYTAFGNIYTIWYENKQSIADMVSLVTQNNLQGFSAWALGLESPDVFNTL